MKKLLLFCALTGVAFFVKAQSVDYGYKLDFNAGYIKPTEGFGVKPGVVLTAEPHAFLSEYFAVGLRFEGAFIGYQSNYDDELFSFFGSTCLTGDYYFSRGSFEPFIGTGGGLFTRHYILEDYESDDLYTSGFGDIKLGFLGRVGFEAGHIKVTGTYNVIAANFSYVALTIGYTIGQK